MKSTVTKTASECLVAEKSASCIIKELRRSAKHDTQPRGSALKRVIKHREYLFVVILTADTVIYLVEIYAFVYKYYKTSVSHKSDEHRPELDEVVPVIVVDYDRYTKPKGLSCFGLSGKFTSVLAIMSFTLNRVYTEWYRNQGLDFTITSSTAFDHKWIPERNYYDTISVIVDELFTNYLSRPNVRQPILTQYCDGQRVSCPGWMTQWGSKALGDQGYSAIEILRYFYGDNMYINIAEEVSGIPSSWPGYILSQGTSGDKVRQIQEQLNVIASAYPAIPKITADGVYGPATANAVEVFLRQPLSASPLRYPPCRLR